MRTLIATLVLSLLPVLKCGPSESSRSAVLKADLLVTEHLVASKVSKDDHVIVLIEGKAATTDQFGYSGKASLYKANSVASSGLLIFGPVEGATDIDCERISTANPKNIGYYGPNGYIPPGVYFLHYYRFDTENQQARHRLGMSDEKCGTTIVTQVNGQKVERTHLQFHVAFNELKTFHPQVSQGCITFSTDNFLRLFPGDFFTPESSPLNSCGLGLPTPTGAPFEGNGDLLVFVTDDTDSSIHAAQLQLFDRVMSGNDDVGLNTNDFDGASSPGLTFLRSLWQNPR